MLTKKQKKWIEHLSNVDKIKIIPYNPKVKIVFDKISKLNIYVQNLLQNVLTKHNN